MKAKFAPPGRSADLIDRSHLWSSDSTEELPKLSLVVAPAGFGKTTLLSQWQQHLQSAGLKTSWVTLYSRSRGGFELIKDLLESIRTVRPDFGDSIANLFDAGAPMERSLTLNGFVDELMRVDEQVIVFVDDYHHSAATDADEHLEILLNLAPPNFHIVISSRVLPQLGQAALRVRNQLYEVNAAELRFTLEEAGAFLNDVRGLVLDSEQIASVYRYNDGWVAGLQLAWLALRNVQHVQDVLGSLQGTRQEIADYLVSEVLNQQSEDAQEFLIKTSIADRLCDELASELVSNGDGASLLQTVVRGGLFIVPLDATNTWYRYHQLFRQFLTGELERRYAGEMPELYLKASEWFYQNGEMSEAVEYAVLSGSTSRVVKLVEQLAWDELMAGRMPQVIDWIEHIPETVQEDNAQLLYLLGTAFYHSNRSDDCERVVHSLEKLVIQAHREGSGIDAKEMDEKIGLLKAGLAISRDDAEEVLTALPTNPSTLNDFEMGIACNLRGYALNELSVYESASDFLAQAKRYHHIAGSEFGEIYSRCFCALADYSKGNFEHCMARFESDEFSSYAANEKYVAPVPAIIRGLVLYQWDRLNEARELLQPNLPLVSEVGQIKLLTLGYSALSRVSIQSGDYYNAMRFYDLILELASSRGIPYERHRLFVESDRIALLLQLDRLNEAFDYAATCGIDVDDDFLELPKKWERVACLKGLVWARLRIASGHFAGVSELLISLRALASQSRRMIRVLDTLILESLLHSQTQPELSVGLLGQALDLGAPNRTLRAFMDYGEKIDELMSAAESIDTRSWSDRAELFFRELSDRQASDRQSVLEVQHDSTAPSSGLIEAVSDREFDVLRLINAGKTNRTIANTLGISENTVKWHLRNIFGKLGVNNRTSAMLACRQLGYFFD